MNPFRRLANRFRRKQRVAQHEAMHNAHSQIELRRLLNECETVIDLGSGASPVEGATAAVDMLIEPEQRSYGQGARIDVRALEARGIQFVEQSIDQSTPFEDNQFDFAYSSHVIEHVAQPGKACDEMMRVAKRGLLRCPAVMAEYLYGREYHRWMVVQRAATILFIEKNELEYSPFGSSADRKAADYSPFEALLDWEGLGPSTPSHGPVARLKKKLQMHFYQRTPMNEVNLFWKDGFHWVELRKDGSVKQGGASGTQYHFDINGGRMDFSAG
ncbi:class I SAM-dependent methyltransferase [Planctomycetota bacterium]|nr:class I SAM-dependent methyltransferase [Planctomycetota bacterium]